MNQGLFEVLIYMMMPTAMEHKMVETLEQSLLIRSFLMILEMILAGDPTI